MAGTDRMRVGDAERERVAERLASAHGEGRLTLAEYDERVRAAHGAVVAADLEPLTADLPTGPGPASAPARASASPATVPERRRPSPLRVAVAVWAVVSLINVVIWVAVSVGTGAAVAPWWIWVAGPWGVVLAVHALAGRAGLPVPAPFPFACGARSLRR
ncbi:DUF1707 domain-containing protein [Actinomycetospora sp. NBRC 106375]|uniref:DUF1707 SHOCT-like domain-containing protein n=1 Tax=Actinomycetospora sp. NBRC 106375 TaxID=3032207 RepID=UPI0025551DAF|nr:DUF1707 domain-containing protein [Actinomycetospora sp. NBRC 106375]